MFKTQSLMIKRDPRCLSVQFGRPRNHQPIGKRSPKVSFQNIESKTIFKTRPANKHHFSAYHQLQLSAQTSTIFRPIILQVHKNWAIILSVHKNRPIKNRAKKVPENVAIKIIKNSGFQRLKMWIAHKFRNITKTPEND